MTKRLTTMLASVVGAFAFVVVPASNAAIHEHSTEAILQVTLLTLSNPNLSVFTSTSDILEMLTLNEIADGENVLDEMPSMNPLPPLFRVRQVTAQTGWVLSGFVDGETWVRAHITFVNSSSEWIAATILVDATVRAEYINPYLFGPDKALSELDCSDPAGRFVDLGVYANEFDPLDEQNVTISRTIDVPPYGSAQVDCKQTSRGYAIFETQESYDAAVTAFEAPDSVGVPPPRREGFAVEVMNQGLEPAAGQVTVHASAGKPDTFVLPFGQEDPLEPGERITLTPDTNWRPPVRDVTVAWDADANWGLDQYPDNDIMTAETEVVRVRP